MSAVGDGSVAAAWRAVAAADVPVFASAVAVAVVLAAGLVEADGSEESLGVGTFLGGWVVAHEVVLCDT